MRYLLCHVIEKVGVEAILFLVRVVCQGLIM